ncbi:unnamed protein product [Nesidiocoris tenuis]|uniref:Uncharacterized protein n=1 Tax=Nesidiocoris tenuis TaxID=355587 RepID=A0A6H5G6N3_9HEMI|nr:unnamed protein product [Nesidiocoris tenuis]
MAKTSTRTRYTSGGKLKSSGRRSISRPSITILGQKWSSGLTAVTRRSSEVTWLTPWKALSRPASLKI